jgi:hypothetical protein
MDNDENTEWRRVVATSPQLSFSMPPDWDTVAVRDSVIAAVSPQIDEERYRSNVTIAETPLSVVGDLENFGDEHLRELERVLTDFQLIEVSDAQVGRLPGIRVTASFRQGLYDLTLDEWLGLSDATMVTATAIAADFDYPDRVASFEQIVASIGDA